MQLQSAPVILITQLHQAEQELKEQNSKIAKLVEKHDKTDKDKNESLKAILSLYAKPMVI